MTTEELENEIMDELDKMRARLDELEKSLSRLENELAQCAEQLRNLKSDF